VIIDFHHHLFNKDWLPKKFWARIVDRAVNVRQVTGQHADPEEIANNMYDFFTDLNGDGLASDMGQSGIDYTLLMPLDLGLEMGECPVTVEEKNRLMFEVTRRHKGKIGAFCGVDPRRKEGLALFEKAVREWGMLGLKLDPAGGYYPNDRMVYPYYEKACELGVPVLFHTGAVIPPFRNKYTDPIYLDDVTGERCVITGVGF